MLISILGVLKAGGAYVPIDSNYPDERIEYILRDTNSKVVLTIQVYCERLENLINLSLLDKSLEIIPVDNPLFQNELKFQAIQNPVSAATSNNLAYVIYTSGTTGKPKGVMIEQMGRVN